MTSAEKYLAANGELHQFLTNLNQKDEFSGTVLVGMGDEILFSGAYGYADRQKKQPMKVDTKLNVGSINKSFTGAAICQLEQAGKLRFSDPVEKYVPEMAELSNGKVTLALLLNHTSGMGNFMGVKSYRENIEAVDTVNDLLKYCLMQPLLFQPGAAHSYSNSGFVVLGAVVERVSGMDYFDYIDENIYKPAGMINSGCFRRDDDVPNLAVGYVRPMLPGHENVMPRPGVPAPYDRSAQPEPNTKWLPLHGCPAGGGYSTVLDFFGYVKALRNNVLLRDALNTVMPEGELNHGRGTVRQNPAAREGLGHSGGAPGINSIYETYPNLGYTFVVQCNIDSFSPVLTELRRALIPETAEKMPPRFEVDGKTIPGVIPEIINGTAYMPIETLCAAAGTKCQLSDGTATITADGVRNVLKADMAEAEIDGKIEKMRFPCLMSGGTFMVPVTVAAGSAIGFRAADPVSLQHGIVKISVIQMRPGIPQ